MINAELSVYDFLISLKFVRQTEQIGKLNIIYISYYKKKLNYYFYNFQYT